MGDKKPTCKTCCWSDFEKGKNYGRCRVDPPVTLLRGPGRKDEKLWSGQPLVYDNEWCSRHPDFEESS